MKKQDWRYVWNNNKTNGNDDWLLKNSIIIMHAIRGLLYWHVFLFILIYSLHTVSLIPAQFFYSANLQSCGCRLAIFVNKQNNKI